MLLIIILNALNKIILCLHEIETIVLKVKEINARSKEIYI